MPALRDLFVRFRIATDGGEKLKEVDKDMKSLASTAKDLGRALRTSLAALAVVAVRNWIDEQIRLGIELKRNSETLGLSTDELQKYQYVANSMGIPVQQTAVAFRFFNRAVGEAAFGTKSAVKTFGQLGIQIRDTHGDVKPTDELLFEFADKLKGVKSQAERTALAMRTLGRGGAALLPMLQEGSAELRQMFKDVTELGGGFDEEFIQKANAVNREQKRLAMGWRTMAAELLKEVLPILQKWIQSSIETVKVLIDYAKHTHAIRTALYMLGATLAGIVAWFIATKAILIATNPEIAVAVGLWTALAAAFTGIYLVLDDVAGFINGDDSLLGRMLDKLGGTGTALQFWYDMRDAIQAIKDAFSSAAAGSSSLGATFSKFIAESLPSIVKWGGEFTTWVVEKVDAAISLVRQLGNIAGAVIGNITAGPTALGNAVRAANAENDKITADFSNRSKAYHNLIDTFDSIGKPKVHPAVPGAGTDQPDPNLVGTGQGDGPRTSDPLAAGNIQINIQNTIHGAGDAKATADAVGKATKTGVKDGMSRRRDTYTAVTAGMPATN